jgi:hypothetical protein
MITVGKDERVRLAGDLYIKIIEKKINFENKLGYNPKLAEEALETATQYISYFETHING